MDIEQLLDHVRSLDGVLVLASAQGSEFPARGGTAAPRCRRAPQASASAWVILAASAFRP